MTDFYKGGDVGDMDLEEIARRLEGRYRADGWWPASSPFEVMVGAILTQQTNWRNVDAALDRLRGEGLEVDTVALMPLDRLEEACRPAGFYRQKASRIRNMADHIRRHHGSDPMGLLSQGTEEARRELLSLPGVGRETADSILVFAAGRPRFVAAAYTSRILSRTGTFVSKDYDEVQRFVESRMPADVAVLGGLYARMVMLAKEHCLVRPRCEGCPLADGCGFNRR